MPEVQRPSDLTGKDVVDRLKGTRLAAHLTEVRDRFGANDAYLKALAGMALKGKSRDLDGGDIFTSIRDRLAQHATNSEYAKKDPLGRGEGYGKQANALAYGLNWHRVNDAIQLDQYVDAHVRSMASDRLKQAGNVHRAARELFLNGKGNADLVGNFWASMHDMADKQVGPNSALGLKRKVTRQQLEASLERLARLEEYRAGLADRGRRQLKETRPSATDKAPTGPVDQVDTMNWLAGSGPAYDNRKGRPNPVVRPNLDPEQYQKEEEVFKFTGALNRVLRAVGLGSGPEAAKGPDGVAFSGSSGSAENPSHPANLERQAVGINLHGLGVIDLHDPAKKTDNEKVIDDYTNALRQHVKGTLKEGGSGDPLTWHYMDELRKSASQPRTAHTLAGAMAPVVRWFASNQFGHHKNTPDAGAPAESALEPEGHEPIPEVSAGDEDTVIDTPPVQPEFVTNPLEWAIKQQAPVDDAPLPIVGKAPKSADMKLQDVLRRKGRDSSAFSLLKALQEKGIPEEEWMGHLTDKKAGQGLPVRTAQSILNKFKKLTPNQKQDHDPLKFRKQLNDVLKRRAGE